ncbi:MAG: hypothetical protein EOO20_08290 [Chryseobacterium sp.]|nr:MAG: hypothetical protein EOO20_08290 [Chryseobacterium sp.]
MEINATIQVNLENGKMLLVLIVSSLKEQYMLYEYISQNIEHVKKTISQAAPLVDYLTTGCWHDSNILDWDKDYISLV